MKPLSERDENPLTIGGLYFRIPNVGMKPLSERDENHCTYVSGGYFDHRGRNEATL